MGMHAREWNARLQMRRTPYSGVPAIHKLTSCVRRTHPFTFAGAPYKTDNFCRFAVQNRRLSRVCRTQLSTFAGLPYKTGNFRAETGPGPQVGACKYRLTSLMRNCLPP